MRQDHDPNLDRIKMEFLIRIGIKTIPIHNAVNKKVGLRWPLRKTINDMTSFTILEIKIN